MASGLVEWRYREATAKTTWLGDGGGREADFSATLLTIVLEQLRSK